MGGITADSLILYLPEKGFTISTCTVFKAKQIHSGIKSQYFYSEDG